MHSNNESFQTLLTNASQVLHNIKRWIPKVRKIENVIAFIPEAHLYGLLGLGDAFPRGVVPARALHLDVQAGLHVRHVRQQLIGRRPELPPILGYIIVYQTGENIYYIVRGK